MEKKKVGNDSTQETYGKMTGINLGNIDIDVFSLGVCKLLASTVYIL